MNLNDLIIFISFIVIVTILARFIGKYIYKVFAGEKTFLNKIIEPFEKLIYKFINVKIDENMSGRKYFFSILIFMILSFLFLFSILVFQGILPLNKEKVDNMGLALAFHTAISFVTNTNLQNYLGEYELSEFSQMIGITVQNFLSAGVGISVLFVLMRGFQNKEKLGNFWRDLIRITLYILLPLSIIVSIILVGNGVIQSFSKNKEITTLEGNKQVIIYGPIASQIAIKQLGSNGGGYVSSNAKSPFENPTEESNFIEMLSILLIPVSLIFTFGYAIKDKKQSFTIYFTMLILLCISAFIVIFSEYNSEFNLEGKELKNGILTSSLWSVITTATSNGSVNSNINAYSPISILILMLNMSIGEVIFGGVGSGLYTMIGFIILTVFLSGLMIGRSPEYLGKKIETYDIKMVLLIILTSPFLTLIFSTISIIFVNIPEILNNNSAHGFTQFIYYFISSAANNGSSMNGFNSNIFAINILSGICMLLSRIITVYGVLKLAENMSHKNLIAKTSGTLETTNSLFVVILILIIIIIGALSFLPIFALGPLTEFYTK